MPPTHHNSRTTHHCPGARLYHSAASVWLSVDPLAEKYPGVSPYAYCGNNPVRLVDPDGREMVEGGHPDKREARFEKFFHNKIRMPLTQMAENGASADELESEAASLANQYQKRLLRGFKAQKEYRNEQRTNNNYKQMIDIKLFSESEERIEVNGRPNNKAMIVCGEIPLGANIYSAKIDFSPCDVENSATFTATNQVKTGWINSSEGSSFSYDLEVQGAKSISYCIQNKLPDPSQDYWSFSVTLRSRRLDIRCESIIIDHSCFPNK